MESTHMCLQLTYLSSHSMIYQTLFWHHQYIYKHLFQVILLWSFPKMSTELWPGTLQQSKLAIAYENNYIPQQQHFLKRFHSYCPRNVKRIIFKPVQLSSCIKLLLFTSSLTNFDQWEISSKGFNCDFLKNVMPELFSGMYTTTFESFSDFTRFINYSL
jgi:hypothetical protein